MFGGEKCDTEVQDEEGMYLLFKKKSDIKEVFLKSQSFFL